MRFPIVSFAAVFLNVSFSGSAVAQPSINTKNFSVDCRPLRGDTERGLGGTKQRNSGFTIVLSDSSQAYYNGPASRGLKYWVVAGDVAHLTLAHRLVAAFATKQQKVQLYGGLQPNAVYTISLLIAEDEARTPQRAR